MSEKKSNKIKVAKGEQIFNIGQGCDAFYIIKEGQVEIYKVDSDKQRIPLAILNSGDFLGEMALLRNSTHTSTAVALTETHLVKVTRDVFQAQLDKTPAVVLALLNQMTDRLQRTNEVIRSHSVVDEKIRAAIEALENHDEDEEE